MKIEQRCGRVDRIGQQRDVHIYNFIVGETVENRVREVLEEKLSVILKEMGVDKYSDVLDSEVAECDFTDVYMRSIGHASQVEKNLYPVEAEMKQQLTNAQKYKDVIREEKDLTKLVGTESNFDVDSALRTMLTYYECWQGHDPRLIDRISIADEEITQHLKTELVQDRTAPLMSIQIDNFPNEEGYFMLWELSISEKRAESGFCRYLSTAQCYCDRWQESVLWMFSSMETASSGFRLRRMWMRKFILSLKKLHGFCL